MRCVELFHTDAEEKARHCGAIKLKNESTKNEKKYMTVSRP